MFGGLLIEGGREGGGGCYGEKNKTSGPVFVNSRSYEWTMCREINADWKDLPKGGKEKRKER